MSSRSERGTNELKETSVNLLPPSSLHCIQEIYCCVKFQRRVSSVPTYKSAWDAEWKEEVGRKGVSCCGWAKRIQPRAANQGEPHHVQSSFPTCVEAKYQVKAEFKKSEMPCTRRTPQPRLLLILIVYLALGKSQLSVREQQENGQKRSSAFAKFALLFLWSEAR